MSRATYAQGHWAAQADEVPQTSWPDGRVAHIARHGMTRRNGGGLDPQVNRVLPVSRSELESVLERLDGL
jgi:hypothetical protein